MAEKYVCDNFHFVCMDGKLHDVHMKISRSRTFYSVQTEHVDKRLRQTGREGHKWKKIDNF